MRFSTVLIAALALSAAWLLSAGCAGDANGGNEEGVSDLGSLQLPLSTVGESGSVYQLINAEFEIRDVQTGRLVTSLSSEDDPFSPLLRAELESGNYTVTLLPGWTIIRDTSGGEVPVPAPFPGIGGAPDPVFFGEGGAPGNPGSGGTGSVFQAGAAATPAGGAAFEPESPPEPEPDFEFDTDFVDTDFEPDMEPRVGEVVNAALESDAIQFVSIFPNEQAFVFFTFRVGDNVISFQPGAVNVVFSVVEDGVSGGGVCDDPDLARRPSVMETNLDALVTFDLRTVFDSMALNEGLPTPGELIYQEVIDSYATAEESRLPDAVHCGDETTNGVASLNGYPIMCDRLERFQFDNLEEWFPMAIVNRIDLAPQNGAHCGQQRMIFGNNAQNRMFIIVEAQIPNPNPEAGINGCTPLAQFWADQVQIADPLTRALRLAEAFLFGSSELAEAGFGPFVTASNYTVGSGQIRTNNFDDFMWTLREFKLTLADEDLMAIPFPVGESPRGELWDDTSPLPQGAECRDAFVDVLSDLATDNPAAMSFVVPQACRDSESLNDFFTEDYPSHLLNGSGEFLDQLAEAAAEFDLSPEDVAARARFSGSCIGCHEEAGGSDLGHGVSAPFSTGFVHVQEFAEPCLDGTCFGVSQALADVFLPHRIDVMQNLVEVPLPSECGADDPSEPGEDAGAPLPGDAGTLVGPPREAVTVPDAVLIERELPSAETPTAELVEQDAELREAFGERTIGGQSAQVSH